MLAGELVSGNPSKWQCQPINKAKAVASSRTDDDADDASSGEAGGGPVELLPLHLTEKILYRISPLASAHLVAVCKPWAATVSERLARPVPHLFVYLPADHGSDRRGVVFSVSMHSGYPPEVIPSRVRLADTNGLGCVGAMPSGRLAFANFCWCETSVLLVNPITGARQRIHVEKLRGNPVIAAGGADSFVSIGIGELMFWRRSGGEEWSKRSVAAGGYPLDAIMSVANCNGRFYILDKEGYVFLVDATAPPPLCIEKLPAASLFDRFAPPRSALVTEYGHLLESGGEVLFVRRVLASKEDYREILFCRHGADELLSIVGFEVYRLDVEGRRWTEVKELAGDRALFVSPASSFAVRSSDMEGCRSNCIYFVDKKRYCAQCKRDDGNTWGVYSMEDREVLFKQAVTEQGACSSATWFLPRV